MNQIATNKIIKELEKEVCQTHGKSANFNGKNGVIVPSNYCCTEFLNHLTNRVQEEIIRQSSTLF